MKLLVQTFALVDKDIFLVEEPAQTSDQDQRKAVEPDKVCAGEREKRKG